MNEPHVQGELDALLDGALDAARRQAVEAHVASCAQCATALELARRVAQAVAGVPVPDPGDAYWARFADRVESRAMPGAALHAEPAPIYERLLRWLVPPGRWGWVGTAGVLVTATLVVYVGMRGYKPQPPSMPVGREQGRPLPEAPPELLVPPPTAVPQAARGGASASGDVLERGDMPAPEPAPVQAKQSAKLRSLPSTTAPAPQAKAERDAAVPAAPAQEQARAETAPADEQPVRKTQDPVLEFAREALLGSAAAAQARYAGLAANDFAAIPAPDAALLRRWDASGTFDGRLDRAPAPALDAKASPRSNLAQPKEGADSAAALHALERGTTGVLEPAPARPQLEILDALVWPRRQDAAARDPVVALTQAWQRHAATDSQARARVRELAAWLAATSPGSDEKARWEAVRNGAADR